MAGSVRESSFLPTITCSMCAREIHISMMGDHVCGGPAEPSPPPDNDRKYEDSASFRKNPGSSGLFKGRGIPPRVDVSAANRPYFRQDQLTPISASSDSRSLSPKTPADGRRSPYGQPFASMSSSLPSPQIFSTNMDSSFPPFPSQKSKRLNPYSDVNEVESMYAPLSPRVDPSGLLKRMDSIAPGPFDPAGRGPKQNERRLPSRNRNEEPVFREHIQDPSMSSSIHSSSANDSGGRMPRTLGADRPGGYGGFGQPQDNERRPRLENRSNTFPKKDDPRAASIQRSPSEHEERSRGPSTNRMEERRPDNSLSPSKQRRPSAAGPDRSRAPPPRGVSFLGTEKANGEIPPVPTNLNLAAEFGVGNPYHSVHKPSDSQSSAGSGRTGNGTSSSQSSPPSARSATRREPSNTANFDNLMKDLESTMIDHTAKQNLTPPREQLGKPLAKPFAPSMLPPQSSLDPAIQGGHSSPPRKTSANREPVRRPTTSKGDCKACGLPIKGKSVSSADGRLTGRYHKDCFNCTTCIKPFATCTFYVLNDAPYCERHYHKLNGSCCYSCDRGIEGQYLETERKQKFHPHCLTCTDCRRTLRDDYFEINGRVYCERDANRKAQQRNFLGPGSSNRMERRTTRLMVM